MFEYIFTGVLGLFVILIGITNMKGNISTLHSYHRHRVTEENRPAFGKLVGLGTVIVGIGILIFAVLAAIGESIASAPLTIIATVIMILALVVGLGISFYAMKKYNGGIF